MIDDLYDVIDENVNPCAGCPDYDVPHGCKSNGGCGKPITDGKKGEAMYNSPIALYSTETVINQLFDEQERVVLQAVHKVGIDVDRDELLRALSYDREQYEKGYTDGLAYKPPVVTKADRIRAMTDEELAKKISGIEQFALTVDGAWSPEQWLDWLKQEVDYED